MSSSLHSLAVLALFSGLSTVVAVPQASSISVAGAQPSDKGYSVDGFKPDPGASTPSQGSDDSGNGEALSNLTLYNSSLRIPPNLLGLSIGFDSVKSVFDPVFSVWDDTSTVPRGRCYLSVTATSNSSNVRGKLNVTQPCDPPTYQYVLESFNDSITFALTYSHAIVNGSKTQIKSASNRIKGQPDSTYAHSYGQGLKATFLDAPAGWVGDAVNTSVPVQGG